jgi:HKD family nuclease
VSGRGRTIAERLNLYEALLRESYDHGIICTFEFNTAFFEQDCLDTLRVLSHNGNLSVLLDRGTYDEAVQLPGAERPTQANLRYLLHPVAPRGFFHPKLFLFASRTRGRLIFGSSNFTRRGLYSNAELVGCYDYDVEEDDSLLPLFRSAFDFIMKVADKWPGEALRLNLNAMTAEAQWLTSAGEAAGEGECEFLHNLESPLWDQVVSRVTDPVKTVSIVSRFFDKSPAILDRIYESLRPEKIRIYTQNNTTTLTADYLKHPLVEEGVAEILLCVYEDEGRHQDLHAKAVAVESAGETLLAFGSANCTSPALMRDSDAGNIEAMLLLRSLPKNRFKPEHLFDPGRTAVRLIDVALLQPGAREPRTGPGPHPIKLLEANLSEKSVSLRAQTPEGGVYDQVTAVFTLPDDSEVSIPLDEVREGEFQGAVAEELFQKLTEAATVVRVVTLSGGVAGAVSNSVFVMYLQDIKTGRSLRRERLLREARQSPARLSEVYVSILEEGDDEAAMNFLDSLDIYVTDVPVPDVFRAMGPVWERGEALMVIKGRGWQISDSVHEAVINFYERHFKRLRRHVNDRSPAGIPNFMHILLTTSAVLEAQVGRIVGGLSARGEEPLRPEQWAECRRRLESYYMRYKDLLKCLTQDFLRPMLRHGHAAKLKEMLLADAEQFRILHGRMLGLRVRLEELRAKGLRVRRAAGALSKPPFFSNDLLEEKQWERYLKELDSAVTVVGGIVR